MPAFNDKPVAVAKSSDLQLSFPPIPREHILHCSYDHWFPRYRAACIKSRIINLSPEFVDYIREDGIVLADDDETTPQEYEWESSTARVTQEDDGSDSDSESLVVPPNQRFPDIHKTIKDKIQELGGAVAPKLNWTAPKDATWISPHQNTIKCTSPNDIYLLLKSSNFTNHDLEHAFDDCTPKLTASSSFGSSQLPFKPVLVLRSFFNPHTALEFRCFVKHRNLIGITQRDLNFYDFLKTLQPAIISKIMQFFNHRLRYTFPDGSFVFDVYIPEGEEEPLGRVRLIDINPWAPHTDSLLFSWQELLDMKVDRPVLGIADSNGNDYGKSETETEGDEEEDDVEPELRLIEKEDPAAYNFSSTQYSAHKLPKDVVDASMSGEGGMREFAQRWKEMLEGRGNMADWETNDDD